MPFYVYILKSECDGSFYKGFSENPLQRLDQHNKGESHYTSSKTPWKLVYIEELPDKRSALIREKNLKKATTQRLHEIINSNKNILQKFQDD
ncbi:MAG: GIY-YIG nuclease family protein [Ginsengibacter sp.]